VRIDFAPCAKFFGGSEQPRETEIFLGQNFQNRSSLITVII
jgi:hypothetical protein